MADKIIENNQVSVMGRIATGFTFSHQVFGEGFYMMDILVKRLSDSEDRIPVMVSERLIDITQDYVGKRDRRSSDGSQSTLRKIRLHTMYMLGKKCQICFGF